MNGIEAALRRVDVDLRRLGAPWALVGGFAVSVRAEPRFTRDVDVAVAVSGDDEAEDAVRALVAGGYRLLMSTEQDTVGRLATVRLALPGGGGVVVDVLFASSGVESEIARAAEHVEVVAGLTVPVARSGHLIALKLLARDDETRPQDRADLVALRSASTPDDVRLARETISMITERGFARGRDLHRALDEMFAE